MERIIAKVGGSLYDMPDLASRLQHWLARLDAAVVLVPGGGAMADVVRAMDRIHELGEEKAHWLALRTLSCNAFLLAELLPASRVVASLAECAALHATGIVPIMDAWQFAMDDERNADHLPHRWEVTSDSIAARIAQCWPAHRLVLLKSIDAPPHHSWDDAAGGGFVDAYFPVAARGLQVTTVNLRACCQASQRPEIATRSVSEDECR